MSEVHIDRLKMAYVREPKPTPCFLSKVVIAETVRPEKVTETLPSDVHTDVIREAEWWAIVSPPT